jgi:hypothetical protein
MTAMIVSMLLSDDIKVKFFVTTCKGQIIGLLPRCGDY